MGVGGFLLYAQEETWGCTIRDLPPDEYNWREIATHVNYGPRNKQKCQEDVAMGKMAITP